MHRRPVWARPPTTHEDGSLQGLTYIPALSANHLPAFMIPLAPILLLSPPESCISHTSIVLFGVKCLLQTGNLRQAYCDHESVKHRALV